MPVEVPRLEDSVVYQCRGTFRAFETVMQRWLREEGLQIAHFDVLRVLWDGDGVTQNYLAEKIFITESSVAQVINEMERVELVERRVDPNDRRKRMIHLLDKGKELEGRIIEMTGELYALAVKGIDAEKIAIYNSVSEQLRDNANAAYGLRWGDSD